MEQPWAPNVYGYYPDGGRTDRPPSSNIDQPGPSGSSQRRYPTTSQGAFLPPPPLPSSSSSSSMNLPPFSQAFHSGPYHSPPTGGPLPSPGQHMSHQQQQQPQPPMPYSPQVAMPPPPGYGNSYYAVTSPVAMSSSGLPMHSGPSHRNPPHHPYADSPRILTGYAPPMPAMREMTSPASPIAHYHPGGMPPSAGSSSSSSYPSINKMAGALPPTSKRRTASDTQSNDSWDDDKYDMSMDKEDGEQPWGMPQDQYKALNPRDKKQVRNRIGARRFRAKRKEYVVTLEGSLRQRDEEIAILRSQVDSQRAEINDLRHRVGLPSLPPQPPAGLGLSVGGKGMWRDSEDRKPDHL